MFLNMLYYIYVFAILTTYVFLLKYQNVCLLKIYVRIYVCLVCFCYKISLNCYTYVYVQIRDRECAVVPSEDNDTLFVGNICKTWKLEEVRLSMRSYLI